jgi:sulfatase maturation enzyme AslB (radical SAM superfamily)
LNRCQTLTIFQNITYLRQHNIACNCRIVYQDRNSISHVPDIYSDGNIDKIIEWLLFFMTKICRWIQFYSNTANSFYSMTIYLNRCWYDIEQWMMMKHTAFLCSSFNAIAETKDRTEKTYNCEIKFAASHLLQWMLMVIVRAKKNRKSFFPFNVFPPYLTFL